MKDILDKNVLIDDGLWDLQHSLKTFTTGVTSIIMFIMDPVGPMVQYNILEQQVSPLCSAMQCDSLASLHSSNTS